MKTSDALSARQAILILNAHTKLGPVSRKRLLEAFDHNPLRVLEASPAALEQVHGISPAVARSIIQWRESFDLEREERRLQEHGVDFVCRGDKGYPPMLENIYDPPAGLYFKGPVRPGQKTVAIVGTRHASLYGLATAKRLASDLVRLGFCVISGMARGIDTAAHEGALQAGGETVAILGCGIDIIYPPENLDLYRTLCTQGAVVAELPFGTPATRNTFPMRNRVVSGISQAIIVVESGNSGGSMITARFAGEHGRHLFAVPGRIDQDSSRGCHQLIRDGAVLLRSVDDLLEELTYPGRQTSLNLDDETTAEATGPRPGWDADLAPDERSILATLLEGDTLMVDQIAALTALPIRTINATLLMLELKKRVLKQADGRFAARG